MCEFYDWNTGINDRKDDGEEWGYCEVGEHYPTWGDTCFVGIEDDFELVRTCVCGNDWPCDEVEEDT